MSDGWWAVAVGSTAFAWVVLLDLRWDSEARLARWWVRRARSQGRSAGPVSLAVSSLALLGYLAVAYAAEAVAQALATGPTTVWQDVAATLPPVLAYAPFVFATMPVQYGGYRDWRAALAGAGADPGVQRAIAWWAGAPSLVGLGMMFFNVSTVFVG
jgi:hypothetical protein